MDYCSCQCFSSEALYLLTGVLLLLASFVVDGAEQLDRGGEPTLLLFCNQTGHHKEIEEALAELCVSEAREILVGQETEFLVCIRHDNSSLVYTLALEVEQEWIAEVVTQVDVEANNCTTITVHGEAPGLTHLNFKCLNSTPSNISCPFTWENLRLSRRRISVARSFYLNIVIEIVGWIYAVAGIISFYPQIYRNFRRRCVEGLSFDFLGMNFTGGLAYAMFNLGLYLIPQVKMEYFHRHPGGVNPVLLNDVVFSVNAAFAQGVLILQCFLLKRGKQKVSYAGVVVIALMWLVMIVSLFVTVGEVIDWLGYLYIVSYVKLAVTPIKYIPQIWTNFRLKSTVGFSVGYSLLEVIGGSFSVFQMFLLSYNYDDWKSIFGDPTKFGFGVLTVIFALILLLQHLLYRSKPTETEEVDHKDEVCLDVSELDVSECQGDGEKQLDKHEL